VSARSSRWAWIGQRRGNRRGPIDRSDLAAFRAIGVILLAVAVTVTGYFGWDFDYAAYTTFRGELRTARGVVVAVEPTGAYEPQTRITASRNTRYADRDEIIAVRYSFVGPDKVERLGVSYRPESRLAVGASVTIEHPGGRPEVSRIRAYRTAKFDSLPIALPIVAGARGVLLGVGLFWRVGGEGRGDC
jgi:hypothetical protein